MHYEFTGVCRLALIPDNDGLWQLHIGEVLVRNYTSLELAVSDVAERETGWDDWDCVGGPKPKSLADWQKIS